MTQAVRNTIIVIVFAVAMVLVVILSYTAGQSASDSAKASADVAAQLRQRSPVTDYITAWFAHTDCRKALEDAFLANVGTAQAIDRTDLEAVAKAQQQLVADGEALANVAKLCPTPKVPIFNDRGDVTGYEDPTTTTSSAPPGG